MAGDTGGAGAGARATVDEGLLRRHACKGRASGLLHGEADRLKRQVEFHKHAFAFTSKFAEGIGFEREAPFWAFTVDAGIDLYSATLTWLEKTIEKIEGLGDDHFERRPSPKARQMDARKVMTVLDRVSSVLPQRDGG